jgi:flavorubredoxin
MHMHVTVLYESTMGRTRAMAQAICEGVQFEGFECELVETSSFKSLDGVCALAVGSSTRMKRPLPEIRSALSEVADLRGISAASFGSYGWSGEAPDVIADRLKELGAILVENQPIKAKDFPSEEKLEECRDLGRKLAKECRH